MASRPLISVFLLLFIGSVICSSAAFHPIIRLPTERPTETDSPSHSDDDDGVYCASWHLASETNNADGWTQIPSRCLSYVKYYMTGKRYESDCEVVANFSLAFASTVEMAPDGKDAWVFDIDEALLTNLPYYMDHGFGSEVFNESCWDEWVASAKAPAIPSSLKLYNALKQMGFKIFVLTGRSEHQRQDTSKNLELAGYTGWEGLILRGASDGGIPATIYKSERRSVLLNGGYRIHGSSGDQWSDLLGFAVAKRSFKLPNPMYYIG
ncbi:hypothetical protein V6N13_000264 [Hibiscus sabdariffa]|uniref:Acid phosphatase n=1 Tax=Hibiscus sabdariffa TaxID=183260 RepID=A0ABR2G4R7_9ROSI